MHLFSSHVAEDANSEDITVLLYKTMEWIHEVQWFIRFRMDGGHASRVKKICKEASIIQPVTVKPYTLPETNGLHVKMDGWNTIVSFWDDLFAGAFAVSFREGNFDIV